MYTDSFFRHTNQMLALLKQAGHIQTGLRSQSTALKGGYWNRVMHFQAPGKSWVIKQFVLGDENLMFPNLPDHEAQALRDLTGSAIAPAYVDFLPNADGGPVLIYEYQEGTDWRDDVNSIGLLLRKLHDKPVSDNFRTLNIEPTAILDQSQKIISAVAGDNPIRLQLDALKPEPVSHPRLRQICLVHTDCGPGNIIVGDDGPVLIDWQCPGLGDPVEDLVCFTSPGIQLLYGCPPLGDEQILSILNAYNNPVVTNRFHALRQFYHFRLACYFLSRSQELDENNLEQSYRYDQALDLELCLLRGLTS